MTYAGVVASASAMTNLGSVNLASAAANIDFTSISSSYQHLQVTLAARGTSGAVSEQVNLRLNGDSGTGFYQFIYHRLFNNDSAPGQTNSTSTTQIPVGFMPGSSSDVRLSAVTILIPFYSQTFWHTVQSRSSQLPSSLGNFMNTHHQGQHQSNTPITRVTLLPASGNFAAGTYATLHGIT